MSNQNEVTAAKWPVPDTGKFNWGGAGQCDLKAGILTLEQYEHARACVNSHAALVAALAESERNFQRVLSRLHAGKNATMTDRGWAKEIAVEGRDAARAALAAAKGVKS